MYFVYDNAELSKKRSILLVLFLYKNTIYCPIIGQYFIAIVESYIF